MKILLDHCAPKRLKNEILKNGEHIVQTAYERGWERLKNGELLNAAEAEKFDLLLTVDQNLRYQQNLTGRTIRVAIFVAEDNRFTTLAPFIPALEVALKNMEPGEVIRIGAPTPIIPTE